LPAGEKKEKNTFLKKMSNLVQRGKKKEPPNGKGNRPSPTEKRPHVWIPFFSSVGGKRKKKKKRRPGFVEKKRRLPRGLKKDVSSGRASVILRLRGEH